MSDNNLKDTTPPTFPAKPIEVAETTAADSEPLLFPTTASGKRIDYGTNNTLELLERIPGALVDLKLDEVLTAVKTVDNLCDYQRCKTKTNLMGHDCGLCSGRYCFKHALPEVHGCGEAVKKEERKKFMHPKTAKTVRQEENLAQAKKKLHAKLKDMQVGRLQKTGGSAGGEGGDGGRSRKKKSK